MRFLLLGPLEVHDDDGASVPVGGPQQRAVLALLLLRAHSVVSAEWIIDQVWGERAPPTARSLLQGCVAGLRRALRTGTGGLLVTRAPGYVLRPEPRTVDLDDVNDLVAAAERHAAGGSPAALDAAGALLRRAAALWRGPAFDGITVDACRAEAARLDGYRLSIVDRRVDVDLACGRHAVLVPELSALVREHPLRERFWAQLMTALHRDDGRAAALDAYRRVRGILREELGVEPGAALQRVHREIIADTSPSPVVAPPEAVPDAAPEAEPETAPEAAPDAAPVPAQLPAAVAAFAGRDAELARLDRLLDAGGPAMAVGVICGAAGTGKTSLAVQWAHRVADRLPDGQLYVNLRGYATAPPMRPIEALTGFLRSLGVPADRVPPDGTAAADLFRTLLAQRRTLVVLDNARDAEQVRPLLPGGTRCVVLVTSRHKLGGLVAQEGADHVPLDPLPADTARALLFRVLGPRAAAEPDAVTALAELCGFLPLALRIAAANLTVNPKRGIADHVAELRDGNRLAVLAVNGDERGAVRTAFDLSYAGLAPDARALFRRLGLTPGSDVDADAAAALGGISAPVARALLDRLADAHLLDEHAAGRYTFHDLLRLYAIQRATDEEPAHERRAALDRLYTRYLARARAAADVLYPHMLRLPDADPPPDRVTFDGHAAALRWLEGERHNLVLAVRYAAVDGPQPSGWLLADALRGYFHLRRYTADWLAVADAALAAAERAGDEHAQAAARHSLGTAYRGLGDHREALRHYTVALRLARRSGWRESEATTLGNLGIVERKLGRLTGAVRRLEAALDIDRDLGRRAGVANNLGLLATVHCELGRLDEAAAQFTAALDLNIEIGSRHGEALALTGLGQVCHAAGRTDRADAHLRAALERCTQVGDRDGYAVVQCHLAALECDLGRPAAARDRALAALDLAREIGDRTTEALAHNAVGTADRVLGRPDEAVRRHRAALELARATASRHIEGETLLALAAAHDAADDATRRDRCAHEALALAERDGFRLVAERARAHLLCASDT
ncbi:AfsR/SARP family transcriptional regulator [Virgisporangium aurantiacum]|uniref:SARP family transcriptional regulator n=1 Tax=Virgisporangium aurantiacum TaxID=175570 RepID=A0A8J3Z739_9ACTN|nr:BTAD domain-containing putative transcriptional regulator [Virgisporangium aurantiacum]GIJ58636.1 SARP family transcriptional regulator [Virgisporangium aurantiacum]